jgi:hypothetical protein
VVHIGYRERVGRIVIEGSGVWNRNEQTIADPALYSQPSYPAVMLKMVDFFDAPHSTKLIFLILHCIIA